MSFVMEPVKDFVLNLTRETHLMLFISNGW